MKAKLSTCFDLSADFGGELIYLQLSTGINSRNRSTLAAGRMDVVAQTGSFKRHPEVHRSGI